MAPGVVHFVPEPTRRSDTSAVSLVGQTRRLTHPHRQARAPSAADAFLDADGQTAGVTILEFWPDYGPGPVWTDDGKPVDLAQLGVDPDLVAEVAEWNGAYSEDKVPIDSP